MRALFSAVFVLMLVAAPTLVAYAADTSVGTKVDDTGITTKVKAKLTAERAKNLVSVHVDTTDGVVHLQGTVPTEADKAEAERLARATDGVKDVQNNLTVAGGTTSSPSGSPPSR